MSEKPASTDPYARTRRKESRLRAMVARAHQRIANANGYDAAARELLKLGLGKDEKGEVIPISHRTRVQALRAYLSSAERVGGSGVVDKPDPGAQTPPKVVINIGLPEVRVVDVNPAPVIDTRSVPELPPAPPTVNGNGHTNGHAKEGT